MRKHVTQITLRPRRSPYMPDRDRFAEKKETRYDLDDFGRRGHSALHSSRYAACDIVDIHSGVRRTASACQPSQEGWNANPRSGFESFSHDLKSNIQVSCNGPDGVVVEG